MFFWNCHKWPCRTPFAFFWLCPEFSPKKQTSRKNRIGTPPVTHLRLNSACSSRSWPSKRPGSTEAMVQVSSRSNSPCSWPSPHMLTGWMKGDFFYWDREIRRVGSLLTTTFCRVLGSLVRSFEKNPDVSREIKLPYMLDPMGLKDHTMDNGEEFRLILGQTTGS